MPDPLTGRRKSGFGGGCNLWTQARQALDQIGAPDRLGQEVVHARRQAGFAVVVEGVVEPIAVALTQSLEIPVIGIGASAQCDGQVLVVDDMLGMFERVPRFVKKYGNLADEITDKVAQYAADVRAREFPTKDQTYQPK